MGQQETFIWKGGEKKTRSKQAKRKSENGRENKQRDKARGPEVKSREGRRPEKSGGSE